MLHGEPDGQGGGHPAGGTASAWAARAQPGDPAALWGPRSADEPPADTDWFLLAADERGIDRERVSLTGYWRHATTPLEDEE